jgi:hypothetical protein
MSEGSQVGWAETVKLDDETIVVVDVRRGAPVKMGFPDDRCAPVVVTSTILAALDSAAHGFPTSFQLARADAPPLDVRLGRDAAARLVAVLRRADDFFRGS